MAEKSICREVPKRTDIVPLFSISKNILLVRGQRVILDADLAFLYGVRVETLHRAVKRHPGRFPPDFAFALTPAEKRFLIANCLHLEGIKHSPGMPLAFTDYGAIMAATALRSRRAEAMCIHCVRAFIRFRRFLAANAQLARKVAELERRSAQQSERVHTQYFDGVRALLSKGAD
jgi:ORF6N domain-containing protein